MRKYHTDAFGQLWPVMYVNERVEPPFLNTLPGAAPARAAPAAVTFGRRRRTVRLFVMDAHHSEAARPVRTPLPIWSKSDILIIGRPLSVNMFGLRGQVQIMDLPLN